MFMINEIMNNLEEQLTTETLNKIKIKRFI